MTFTIDGRKYEDYQLSNEQIVKLIKDDENACSDQRDFLMDKVLSRFENECCARKGESKNELFARQFSNYVNRIPNNFAVAAKEMGKDYRYLQCEMFRMCLEYMKVLSKHCEIGAFDDRNKWAVETAHKVIKFLGEDNLVI